MVILYRGQGQIQVERGKLFRVQLNIHAKVELFDIGAQLRWAHAKEDPVDLIRKCLDDVKDHLQIPGMAGSTCPADARLITLSAQAGQIVPPVIRETVFAYHNIRMDIREGLCQWLRRNHKAVHIAHAFT